MRFLTVFFVALTICLLKNANGEENDKLTFGTVHFPPYSIVSDTEIVHGFDADVVREAFLRMGKTIEVRPYPWKRAVQLAEAGEIAGVLSCSPRPKSFYMSDPISTATDALFFRKSFDFNKYPIMSISDLQKYPELLIGGVNGYKHLRLLDQKNITYDLSPNDETAFKKLFNKRIDVMLTVDEFAKYVLKNNGLSDSAQSISLRSKLYHLCFSKFLPNVHQLKERFNQTLLEMRKDGTYQQIHKKYK